MIKSIFNSRILIMLIGLVPLLIALRWVAIHFPISVGEYWVHSKWIDDRFVVIQNQYLPIRHGITRGYNHIFREYLFDCELRTRTELEGPVSVRNGWPELPTITGNGTIVRLYRGEYGSWRVRRINPQTLQSIDNLLGRTRNEIIGDRFLLESHYYPHQTLWRDLKDDELTEHQIPWFTFPFGNIEPVRGADAFYLTLPIDDLQWINNETGMMETTVPWLDELGHTIRLQLPPHLVSRGDVHLLMLFAISNEGPKFVTQWPFVIPMNQILIDSNDGFIATPNVDATTLEIRQGLTGRLVTTVPIPANGLPADFRISWMTHSPTVSFWNTSKANQSVDLKSKIEIKTDGCLNRRVLDRFEDRYLTIQDADLSKLDNWPLNLQLRGFPSGSIIRSFPISVITESIRFSLDGSKVKYVDPLSGHVVFVDVHTGKEVRLNKPSRRHEFVCYLVAALACVWVCRWFVECRRHHVPVLIRSLVITICAVIFLTMRLQLSGHDQFYDRIAWQFLYAITLAWGMAVSQLVFQKNFSMLQQSIATLGFSWITFEIGHRLIADNWAAKLTCYHFALTGCLLSIWACILWLFGYLPSWTSPFTLERRLTVRTLFGWVFLAACAAAWTARIDWYDSLSALNRSTGFNLLINCSVRITMALFAYWSIRNFGERPIASALASGLAGAAAIIAMSFLFSDGFQLEYLREGFWYASWEMIAVAGVVLVGFQGTNAKAHTSDVTLLFGRGTGRPTNTRWSMHRVN